MTEEEARARCWAEIDLDALEANYLSARAMLSPGAALIPVLKGNAYGLGAVQVARALHRLGARFFAVATVTEALELTRALDADVLVMGAPGDALCPAAVRAGVVLTAYSRAQAQALSACALAEGRSVRVHFKVDTGMHRLGFDPDSAAREIARAARLPMIRPEGVFTHLALHSEGHDARQFEAFDRVLEELASARLPLMPHVLDSIGLTRYPARAYGAARVGAWLYGVRPAGYTGPDCLPVMALKARVTQLRRVKRGELIGYDDDQPLKRGALVATLSVGFADGYPRLTGTGQALILGARADVLGRVCMDQMMVDATNVPGVAEGDEAILLGGGIALDEYAAWGALNRNDALCRIARRVPRLYVRSGRVVQIADEMNY